MLRCITEKKNASSPSATTTTASTSLQDTRRSEAVVSSPTLNLSRELNLALQTNSYKEVWTKIHNQGEEGEEIDVEITHQVRHQYQPLNLSQVLQPNRECVEEALSHSKENVFTKLVAAYFNHSENTSNVCLHLHHSVEYARITYARVQELLEHFPLDVNSVTDSQCNWAFDIFVEFDSIVNSFPSSEFHNFQEMRLCFSQLKQQLDHQLGKSKSRVRFTRRANAASAFCLIGTVVGVAVSALVIAGHAVVGLVATGTILPALFCPPQTRTAKKEHTRMAQLDAADKCIYVLNNDIDTIDRLVASLYTTVEGDKNLVRIGLGGGRHKFSIFEVVKQLRKNQLNFLQQLDDLEIHTCLGFVAVNRARSLLLQEILDSQAGNS